MALQVSQRTTQAAEQIQKTPVLVLCIDGLDTKYGSSIVYELIRIGDPGLLIDGTWVIGGQRAIEDQFSLLSMNDSTNQIRQVLDIDKGRGASISSLEIGLVDKDLEATKLISPGVYLDDILGRRCEVYVGFDGVPFSEFNIIFRGNVDDVKSLPGLVKINLAHPDNKKRQLIAPKTETKLVNAIDAFQTTGIILEDADDIILPTADTSFASYVRIDDELIKFTGITMANELTGVTRAALVTAPNAHAADASIDSFYVLEGNAMDLALKIMLSGPDTYFETDVPVTNFQQLPDLTIEPNAIYFEGINVQDKYGLVIGDFVTVTGATNGANNFVNRTITGFTVTDTGSFFVVDGAPLVDEVDSPAECSFRSKYNTLPNLIGLGMTPFEVDVKEHERLKTIFLGGFNYRFYFKETIENANEFIEQEIYKPAAAFSLPRKAKSSVGLLTPPIPGADTVTIRAEDVVKPQNLTIRRTTAKAFFNHIVYQFEQDSLEDKFLRGVIYRSQDSINRIPVGAKPLVIKSLGMRTDLNATGLSDLASERRLKRYEFGAEFFENVELTFGRGFRIEIGDVVVFDHEGLKISDTASGTREKPTKLYSVENTSINLKTGQIQVHLVDTAYSGSARYGLFGPSSLVRSGLSNIQFIIEPFSLETQFGVNEGQRWSRFKQPGIKVRSPDFTTRFFETNILSVSGNTVTVVDPMPFVPQAGDVMELCDYDFEGVTDEIKLLYLHWQDAATFPSDGKDQYKYL